MRKTSFGQRVGEHALLLLFPEPVRCPLCGYAFRHLPRGVARPRLCSNCARDLSELTYGLCRVCGRAGQGAVCPECAREPHVFFAARAFASYDGSVEKLIKALKYQGDMRAKPILGDWLVEAYERHYGSDGQVVIVPVPMHPTKQAQRGFNQAEDLAAYLCRKLNLPLLRALTRVETGSSQTTHTRSERKQALRGAFTLNTDMRMKFYSLASYRKTMRYNRIMEQRVSGPTLVTGQHVILVDDVITTGSTADACAEVLFAAQAVSVSVLRVAR
ncbi:MAG: ComF family protein [Bacilli bacterium]